MPYQYCDNGLYCYSSETTSVTASTVGCLVSTVNTQYAINGARIYDTNFTNNSIFAQTINDLGYSSVLNILTTPGLWSNAFPAFNSAMNRYAVWYDQNCDGIKETVTGEITISHYFNNTGTTNQYYLGFGVWM